MTSRYTHAMPENLRTAVDSLTKKRLSLVPELANSHSESSLTVELEHGGANASHTHPLSRYALSAGETPALPKSRQLVTETEGM